MKKIIYMAAMACMLTVTGCDDFLTPENKSNVTDTQFFSTAAGFESLVNDAYTKLKTVYTTDPDYFNDGTDMYCDARNKISEALHQYLQLTPENGVMKELYTNCYKGIRAACAVEYYAADCSMNDAQKSKRIDEARVLRAHFYYLLVNTFGGVPLMNEFVTNAATGYPRSSAADVYEYIIKELEEIISAKHLDASSATNGGGRVSMESAKALLANIYLSAAWDLNKNEYFGKAAQYADAVINNRKLNTPFADLWKADRSGDDNEEFLFDIDYNYDATQEKNGGGHSFSSYFCNYLGGNEDNIKATSSMWVPTVYALQCFEKGDVRYDVTFMKSLPNINAKSPYSYYTWYENKESHIGVPVMRYYSAWYETEEDVAAWRAQDPENRKDTYVIPMAANTVEPQEMTNDPMSYDDMVTYVYGGSPCRKFDDCVTASKVGSNNFRDIHIFTLPEMYLVAAEAYMKAGDNGNALSRLNEVRRRAGLAAATGIDVDAILKERVCELFGQGSRWFDLRRTQTLIDHNDKYNPQLKGSAASYIGQKLLRPIPQAAIDANDLLTKEDQNPGY